MNDIIKEDVENIVERIKHFAPQLKGSTILISGCAGFLGKYALYVLDYMNHTLDLNCRIVGVDNMISGSNDFLDGLQYPLKNIYFIEKSITNGFKIKDKIDYILNFAGIASPVFYKKYPIETIDIGTLGTKNILEMARTHESKSIVLFSSSEVYGDPNIVPTPETYNGNVSCTGPRSQYDESKRILEAYGVAYYQSYKLPIKILRPFNVFGPGFRLDDGRVIANFVVNALKGQDIPLYGNGNQTRTFCYITDAIVGIFQTLFCDFNGESFNIGNDANEITMDNLAKLVLEKIPRKVVVDEHDVNNQSEPTKIKYIVGPNDAYGKSDPKRRCPDLHKIKTFIKYEPIVDISTGIDRFISWVKTQDYAK